MLGPTSVNSALASENRDEGKEGAPDLELTLLWSIIFSCSPIFSDQKMIRARCSDSDISSWSEASLSYPEREILHQDFQLQNVPWIVTCLHVGPRSIAPGTESERFLSFFQRFKPSSSQDQEQSPDTQELSILRNIGIASAAAMLQAHGL